MEVCGLQATEFFIMLLDSPIPVTISISHDGLCVYIALWDHIVMNEMGAIKLKKGSPYICFYI